MLDQLVRHVAAIAQRPRSRLFQVVAVCGGAAMFLVIVPWALGRLAMLLPMVATLMVYRGIEIGAGIITILAGLLMSFWATITFWRAGRGTPVPMAAPQRLVTTGPFRYCRNPIKLGAFLYFLGVGCLWLSLGGGLLMALTALVLGIAYHRFIEEGELRLRFGEAYDEYRRTTPLLIPRWPRSRRDDA
jgi:protein-S-isoprenylcysteine O-methyltransferase Ste14